MVVMMRDSSYDLFVVYDSMHSESFHVMTFAHRIQNSASIFISFLNQTEKTTIDMKHADFLSLSRLIGAPGDAVSQFQNNSGPLYTLEWKSKDLFIREDKKMPITIPAHAVVGFKDMIRRVMRML